MQDPQVKREAHHENMHNLSNHISFCSSEAEALIQSKRDISSANARLCQSTLNVSLRVVPVDVDRHNRLEITSVYGCV